MVDVIVQVMDIVALVSGLFATFYLFKNYKDIVGEGSLKNGMGWIDVGILFIFLRKVSDVGGEYFFVNYDYWFNLVEDAFFALWSISIAICGSRIYKFFNSLRFK